MKNLINIFSKKKTNLGAVSNSEIKKAINDLDFPYLVSYPRTGSHWLRIMLEQYSDRPLLTRSFYEHKNNKYLLYHTHDINLTLVRNKVIYLYRNPSDVIYSLLNYYKQDPMNKTLVMYWTNQYATHLSHWMFNENFTKSKLIISYENLKNDIGSEFEKITNFLNLEWDKNKIINIKNNTTKGSVKRKTTHNEQVVQLGEKYDISKNNFLSSYDEFIKETISKNSELLFGDSNKIIKLFND